MTDSSTENLLIDYKYQGISAAQSSVGLTYSTTQAVGTLQVVDPLPLPYTFPSIIANAVESATQTFTVKNVGNGTAYSIKGPSLQVPTVVQGPTGVVFMIIPSTPSSDACGSVDKSTLAPLGTCLITVRFGPIAQQTGLKTANALLNYKSYAKAKSSQLSVAMQGTLIAPKQANPVISSITNVNAIDGNGESVATAFAFESSATPTTFTVTYKNIGESIADNFTVYTQDGGLSNGYTIDSNGCNDVSLAVNATCTVTLSLPIQSAGSPNLSVNELYEAWDDERGAISGVPSSWNDGQTLAYVTVYAAPSVSAMLSTDSTGTSALAESVNESTNFYVVYKLVGGYGVTTQTYGVDLSGTTGSPQISTVGDATCSLSGQQPSCSIQLNSGGAAINQPIVYTAIGSSIIPTPSSGSVDVITPIPPTISVVTPIDGAINVSPSTSISVTFDMAMESATLIPSNFALLDVSDNPVTLVSPIVTNSGMTVTFSTTAPLTSEAVYHVQIPTPANVKNAAGTALSLSSVTYPNNVITSFTIATTYFSCNSAFVLNSDNSVTRCSTKNSAAGLSFDSCTGNGTPVSGLNNATSFIANTIKLP